MLLDELHSGLPGGALVTGFAGGGVGFVEHGFFKRVEIVGGEEVGKEVGNAG